MNSQSLKSKRFFSTPSLAQEQKQTQLKRRFSKTEDEQEDKGGIIELSCPQFEQFEVKHGVDMYQTPSLLPS